MRANLRMPVHHSRIDAIDAKGRHIRLIATPEGVLNEFREYCIAEAHQGFGHSWWAKATHAVGLLIDHKTATEAADGAPIVWGPRYLASLKEDLLDGTYMEGEASRPCRLGLWWPSRDEGSVAEILRHVTRFGDFCVERYGWVALNPYKSAAVAVRPVGYRPSRRPYGVGTAREGAYTVALKGRIVTASVPPCRVSADQPPAYPSELFDTLIASFRRRGARERTDLDCRHLRDAMIALLQGGGGLRACEPMHLYVEDVVEDPSDPGVARVRVHHPADSSIRVRDPATGRWVPQRRREYLGARSLLPRNEVRGAAHAGWKNPVLDRSGTYRYFQVHWYPRRHGVEFLRLYRAYVKATAALRSSSASPYLFINDKGGPYTIRQYEKKLAIAVRRTGVPTTKAAGGTTHGLRHHYAQALKDAGMSLRQIATYLHQSEEASAAIYARFYASQIRRQLRDAGPLADIVVPPLAATNGGSPHPAQGSVR